MDVRPPSAPQELILVGGGHAHAVVLRRLARRPLPGVRVTLVAADVHAPYSGMLPGLIAGHDTYDETHIDLELLARAAAARLIRDHATGLDLAARRVLFEQRPSLPYDLLSLDVGSTPATQDVPGARRHALPIKPIAPFLSRWRALLARVTAEAEPPRLATVGAGAGGVELTLALHQALCQALSRGRQTPPPLPFALFCGSPEILPSHPPTVRRRLAETLRRRGVELHTSTRVVALEADALVTSDGRRHPVDQVFWVTQACSAPWLARSGLATDAAGFIAVDDCLRSVSHPEVFACGDVAAVLPHPREKAGVFAVRQGPPLERNLRRVLAGRAAQPFRPQRHFLTILSTADGAAVASRGRWVAHGRWVWRWKNHIDRRFMARFSGLPQPAAQPAAGGIFGSAARCTPEEFEDGDQDVVPRILEQLQREPRSASAAAPPTGAASPGGPLLTITSVRLSAPFDDPWLFGRIAATHVLAGLCARGARPRSVRLALTVPRGLGASQRDELLRQLLRGLADVLAAHGAPLDGGRCSPGPALTLCLAAETEAVPTTAQPPAGPSAGDVLLLSTALGTGLILEAARRGLARGRWVEAALSAMQRSPALASTTARQLGATALVAVDERGLARCLAPWLGERRLGARLDPHALPLLDGALTLAERGLTAPRASANRQAVAALLEPGLDGQGPEPLSLLFDPQLAGGLLCALPADRAADCLARWREQGHDRAAILGRIEPCLDSQPALSLETD